MNNKINTLFLEQSYKDCKQYLADSIKYDRYDNWDYIVLTASNEEQAKNYRLQIEKRLKAKVIDNKAKYVVIADFQGERIGSGGATLNVLAELKDKYNVDFKKNKILLIHSGGDSKRIPQYSACGKLFSPVQRLLNATMASTLFDELIATTSIIPSRMNDGVMVMSGDVMILFNPLQIDFKSGGVAAISLKKNAQIGKNHGVFLSNSNGELLEFLHKKSVEELKSKGAVDSFENVDIDTGMILFDGEIANKMLSLIAPNGNVDKNLQKQYINSKVRLSFYADFLYPFAKNATLENYLEQEAEGEHCTELLECRKAYWKLLKDYKMNVMSVSPAEFLHFGTTMEQLQLVTEKMQDYRFLGWEKNVLTNNYQSNCAVYHSCIKNSKIGSNCYLENSVCTNCEIGNGTIVSFAMVDNETIPEGVVLSGLKLNNNKYVVRIFGINDDPKKSVSDNSFMSVNIKKTLENNGINLSVLNTDGSLWNADLYPIADTIQNAVKQALKVYNIFVKKEYSNLSEWLQSERVSLASSFNNADVEWISNWQNQINKNIIIEKSLDLLRTRKSFECFEKLFENVDIFDYVEDIFKNIKEDDYISLIRLNWFLSKMSSDVEQSKKFENIAFENISQCCKKQDVNFDLCKIKKQDVKIELPARVNWGGGWTDTPPYCVENGGTVLNCAIKICGDYPIKAYLKKINENKIILESLDSNKSLSFSDRDEILNCSDPFDPVALQKACLVAMGIVKKQDNKNLSNVFEKIGGGFKLSTEVRNIPRGSGLGTSSILAAACVKAVYEFFGIKYNAGMLFDNVLNMEQIMSTGGGWQDQIGGLSLGVKMITSKVGVQNVNVEQLQIAAEVQKELNDRFVLIYTGQRRLARNLLRDIVGSYICGKKDSLIALKQIEQLACIMYRELQRGDIDAFAKVLSEHWEYSKMLDNGCTNTCIEYIFESCSDMLAGKMICGAGGGGFLQAILKKGVTKQDLQERINSVFGDSGVKVWDCELVF